MKKNGLLDNLGNKYFTLTNKYFYWSIFIVLIGILTLTNNYYFYSHVERSSGRDAEQLNLILESQINYCKINNFEVNSCNDLLMNTINSFSKKAYYNDTIVIDGQALQKVSLPDAVIKSDVKIDLFKDNTYENYKYIYTVNFDIYKYIFSVVNSMTFSITDIINISYHESIKKALEKFNSSYWYRSRPVIVFAIFTYLILWFSRKRTYKLSELQEKEDQRLKEEFEQDILTIGLDKRNELSYQVKQKIIQYNSIINPPINYLNIEDIFEKELDTIGTKFRKVTEKIIFEVYRNKIGELPYRINLSQAVEELYRKQFLSDASKNYLNIVRIYGNISSHYSSNSEITKEEAISIASALMYVVEEIYEKNLLNKNI
jgi:hypothetical protein